LRKRIWKRHRRARWEAKFYARCFKEKLIGTAEGQAAMRKRMCSPIARQDPLSRNHAFALELPTINPGEHPMAAKKEKTLTDLFEDGLKDVYYAEKKILAVLPKMAKATETEELAAAFEKHRMETEQQVERLEEVFEVLNQPPKGKKCPGIDGILEEGKEILEQFKGMPALDAGLLAAAQAVEHYEITRYGTLIAWAEKLGLRDAVPLLEETLEEEKNTDRALTTLAETAVNQYAQAAE
jgi:ferritin-like metal-binding protein YciE